jgi:hypothetical protein
VQQIRQPAVIEAIRAALKSAEGLTDGEALPLGELTPELLEKRLEVGTPGGAVS